MVEEGRRPFDLKTGPLFRAQLLRLAPEEHVLQLTIHHIVADGWSLGVLSKDLTDLYAAAVGASPAVGPPPSRYADLMRRQRQRLTGATYDAQAAYWRDRLTPPPPVLELPADHPRPTIQTFDGAIEAFVLPPVLAEALYRLGREQGVTLFMILLAALDVLLHRYTGLDDIAVGTPIANRTDVEAEKVVGLFTNTLVLRTDLSGDPTVRELLRRVRDAALGAYAAQEFPFERLVEMVQPVRDMSHSPLFQVMLILQNSPFEAVELGRADPQLRRDPHRQREDRPHPGGLGEAGGAAGVPGVQHRSLRGRDDSASRRAPRAGAGRLRGRAGRSGCRACRSSARRSGAAWTWSGTTPGAALPTAPRSPARGGRRRRGRRRRWRCASQESA